MSKQPWASCLKISEVFDLQSRTREKVNSTNPCTLHVYSFAQCKKKPDRPQTSIVFVYILHLLP